jgi:hypothetical protein
MPFELRRVMMTSVRRLFTAAVIVVVVAVGGYGAYLTTCRSGPSEVRSERLEFPTFWSVVVEPAHCSDRRLCTSESERGPRFAAKGEAEGP